MEDEIEDKIFYQTYVSHMKLLSKFAMGISPLSGSFWKYCRFYLQKPEVLICGTVFVVFLIFIQAEVLSRSVFGRFGFSKKTKTSKLSLLSTSLAEKHSWDVKATTSAVYAVQGRRPRMEDRFLIEENINNSTGISLFCIFDGHGGTMAADFAKDILIQNLLNKIIEAANIVSGKTPAILSTNASTNNDNDCERNVETNNNKVDDNNSIEQNKLTQRRQSFKKSMSKTEDYLENSKKMNIDSDLFLDKFKPSSLTRPIVTKETKFNAVGNANQNQNAKPETLSARCYVDKGKINFDKMLTDEILAADYKLVEKAKRSLDVAGTTALIAIMQGTKLIVANVGDSRGVMCDHKFNAIPLSFDHKPQQTREHKRINEAGGFIAFKGVWRVAGILATSRALGDYPLKDKKLVIADPDILTFDLVDHKPPFLILASDGLWDTFTNEEAVAFIKDRLDEPHFGAKSITLQSYVRGSVDNITVLVIVFKNGKYEIGSSSN